VTLVVDASVAVKWVVKETSHDQAVDLVAGETLIAPDFVLIETANILWRKVRIGDLDKPQAADGHAFIRAAYARYVPAPQLLDRAMSLALGIDHPVYDCLYLACADGEGLSLVTADKRLVGKASAIPGMDVIFIGDSMA
jgi:predicted nucleic acid-binding protein